MSGPTTPGKRLPRGHPEGADRHRDGQLEVVSRRGERERGGPFVTEADRSSDQIAAAPHDREVRQQRQRDPHDIQGLRGDLLALQCE